MRTAQLIEYGSAEGFGMKELPVPEPGAGEVLLAVEACGLNPIDVWMRSGHLRERLPRPLPTVLGWDVAGTVAAIGPGVNGLSAGDGVLTLLDFAVEGANAEYVVVTADRVVARPPSVTAAQAAALPCAGLTGAQLVERGLELTPGGSVLVTGAVGAVGRAAVHAALHAGLRVVAAVRQAHRMAAEQLGGVELLVTDVPSERLVEPVDAVIDTAGPEVVAPLLPLVRRGGTVLTVVPLPLPEADAAQQLTLQRFAVTFDRDRLAELIGEVAVGTLSMPVAACYDLADLGAAHRRLEAGGLDGKIVLTMERAE